MQEIGLVEGEEEANKRKRQSGKWSPSRRLRQALFLSGMVFSVFGSTFVLAQGSDGAEEAGRDASLPRDSRKELCLFRVEQALWESFGENRIDPADRTDAMRDCADIVSGREVFVAEDRIGLEAEIRVLVSGYPIETMAPFIASYDREIAALLVGIAKKESNWGKRVPLDNARKDCFNYWGYKGAGSRGIGMGHGCFGSPEEAVSMVGNRLAELVAIRNTSDPANMIIWKCGSSCAGHSPESVRKWIADVNLYYRKLTRS
jgi:hypothetical protein